jgi:hypothetical protein
MRTTGIILICLSALGFVLAVISSLVGGPIAGVTAEGFSYGSTNLALIAIALAVFFKPEGEEKKGEE